MSEKLHRVENTFDLEKEANPDDLKKLLEIVDSFHTEGNFESLDDFYTFDEIKTIRFSLAILYPNLELPSDKQILQSLENESQTFLDRKDLESYLSNAVYRKVIFPEKHESLYEEMDKISIYKTLLTLLESTNKEYNLYDSYVLAKDIKLLYPERFGKEEILKRLKQKTWEAKIIKYGKNLRHSSPQYYDMITDLAVAIKILEYPNNIEFNSYDWDLLKQHKDVFVSEDDYTGLAEYLMKLKIISAQEIKLTKEKILLIF